MHHTLKSTPFPNLHSTVHPGPENESNDQLVFIGNGLYRETLLRSWAYLLRAYTQADQLIFKCNNAHVLVEASSWEIHQITVDHSEEPDQHGTAVFINADHADNDFAVSIAYDENKQVGSIKSSCYVPKAHISQLGLQLQQIVPRVSHLQSMTIVGREKEVATQSTLNTHPKLVSGKSLVHELVRGEPSSCAIDFLAKDRKRQLTTYGQLDVKSLMWASQLQSILKACGAARNSIIPILIPQSPELYVAMLAILRTGCAFVPLDIGAPLERLSFITDDVSASMILTTDELKSRLELPSGIRVLTIENDLEVTFPESTLQEADVSPHDLAYVMYTSGSTGLPKGVKLSHLAVTQSLHAHQKYIPLFQRFLQTAASVFDVSQFEIWFPLSRGCTIVCCDREMLFSNMPALIQNMNVDAAELTPTVAGALIQRRSRVPGLKLLLTIGEMLTPSLVEEFGGSDEQESLLWGMYGPTEAAIHCTLRSQLPANSKVGNIGSPLETVSIFITEPILEGTSHSQICILPTGQIGELVLGGHQLASGYLNRPEQTASAFIQHATYGLLYRTGDKARLLPDGTIECLGRIKSGQVKLRGQRIELGEIEEAILRIRGCYAVAAMVIENVLVAFCLVNRQTVTEHIVVTGCKKWLPSYMIPGDIVLMETIPRLPSGKIDRRLLQQHYQAMGRSTEGVLTNHVTELERVICRVTSEILGRQMQPSANLPAIGLDSLQAIRLAAALRDLDLSISVVDLLKASSIRNISRSIEDVRFPPGNSTARALDRERIRKQVMEWIKRDNNMTIDVSEIEDVFFCTPVQNSMLAETELQREIYCNWIELEFPPETELVSATSLIKNIAAQTPQIRSGFFALDDGTGGHVQIQWKSLLDVQVNEVADLTINPMIGNRENLLRPQRFDISNSSGRVRVRWHYHHALYDGWSLALLFQDLAGSRKVKKAAMRSTFRCVAEFYALESKRTTTNRSRDYWAQQMLNYQPARLPNLNGKRLEIHKTCSISRKMKEPILRIREYAKQRNLSPQDLFQAGVAYLLSLYLAKQDVVFGCVTSGRTIPVRNIDTIIGPCIASLPIRIDLSQAVTCQDLLSRLHTLNREIIAHCTIPLREIKTLCQIPPLTPIFDVLFAWQETPGESDPTSERIRIIDSVDYVEVPLLLEFEPQGAYVRAKATYNTSILPVRQVELLLEQIDCLVTAFVTKPHLDIKILSGCFTRSTLSIVNDSPDNLIIHDGLASIVEKKAQTSPTHDAVLFAELDAQMGFKKHNMSYKEFNSAANQLASYLRERGILPNDIICLVMEKSLNLYISILAMMKVGAGYLPVTPETPAERKRVILEESDAKYCITNSEHLITLPSPIDCEIFSIDKINVAQYSTADNPLPYQGTHIAYMVFTSGTTGKPKGVAISNDNLMSNLKVLSEIYPVSQHSRLLQISSQAHDLSIFEITFALFTGICLCAATKSDVFQDLEGTIKCMNISHLSMTPSVAALIHPENVPSVQFLVTAGEAMTEQIMKRWAGRGLYEGYGPTETTNICTLNPRITPSHLMNNIGPPLRNTSGYVLSESCDLLVPAGGVGELCFGGDQVGQGYANRPELTASKFVVHPVCGRIYRSGDLGRLLSDGSLLIHGRTDEQVKLRGQRIELGEISAVLVEHATVKDCATVITENHPQMLVTFWIPVEPEHRDLSTLSTVSVLSSIQRLFNHMSSKLADYMIPSHLIPIGSLPLTSQGKTDKRRLLSFFSNLSSQERDDFARGTDSGLGLTGDFLKEEAAIATALSKILRIPTSDISRHTSFFSLGLDSISAVALANRLRVKHSSRASVADILMNPSLARLSRVLGQDVDEVPANTNSVEQLFSNSTISTIKSIFLPKRRIESIYPCTALQESMLSASKLSQSNSYMNRMLFKTNCEPERFMEAWTLMCERHEILRTCFVPTDSPSYTFAQVVLDIYSPKWCKLDIAQGSIKGETVNFAREKIEHALENFEPPYALATINSVDCQYLLLVCHHCVYDGFAIAQLLREIELALKGYHLSSPLSYRPFLEYMLATRNAEAEEFWTRSLGRLNNSFFHADELHHESQESAAITSSSYRQQCKKPLSTYEKFSQSSSITLLAILQAAWAKLLAYLTDSPDTCFGNVVSGRSAPVDNLEKLVAPCFNTVPVRVDLSHERTNIDLMKSLQNFHAASVQYELFPLRKIQSRLSDNGQRFFDSLFLLQKEAYILDSEIWTLEEDSGDMDAPIICELIPSKENDTLEFALHYSTKVLSPRSSKLLFALFNQSLETCVERPYANVSLLEHLSSETIKITRDTFVSTSRISRVSSTQEYMGADEESRSESHLRKVFAEMSGYPLSRIYRDTTIFQLGLDSINAIQLSSKLSDLGYSITARDILERPTVSELATLIHRRGECVNEANFNFGDFRDRFLQSICSENSISKSKIESIWPTTPMQQGMLARFIQSEGREYLNYICIELDSNISELALHSAFTTVAHAHEMLRTGFVHINHPDLHFAMVTYNSSSFKLPWHVSSCKNAEWGREAWHISCAEEMLRNLQEPPWRILYHKAQGKSFAHLLLHHSLYDAHSLNLFLEDLTTALKSISLPERTTIRSVLSEILVASADDDTHETFWKDQISSLHLTRFPVLTPQQTLSSGSYVTSYTCGTSISDLKGGCQEANITLQAAGQAAWARLLASYTGEESVTFAVLLSGRTPESNEISFPCIATVPFCCKVGMQNRNILSSAMKFNASVQSHRFTPLIKIQRWAGYPNNPIFDTVFAFQKLSNSPTSSRPWKIIHENASANFTISLEMEPQGDNMVLRATCRTDIIPAEQAVIMLRQFDIILCDLICRPDQDDRQSFDRSPQLQSIRPAEKPEFKSGDITLLHDFVELGARETPNVTALEFVSAFDSSGEPVSQKWTYRELDSEANRVANFLVRKGVKSGDVVAIFFEKSATASFAILGILKVGAAFLGLDTNAPIARTSFIVADAGATAVLCEKNHYKCMKHGLDTAVLDISEAQQLPPALTSKCCRASPADSCYSIYTSGTTGTPKGVLISHESAVQCMLVFQDIFSGRWNDASRWFQFAQYAWDVSVLEQFWPWSVNICVVSAPRDLLFEDLPGMIKRLKITHLDLTPSLARLLHPEEVPSLCEGVFIVGGDTIKPELIKSWGSELGKGCLHNFYGPSEATIGVTVEPVDTRTRPSVIGKAFPNVGVFVLRPKSEVPVILGGVGELCVSGKLVGKGYIGREDLSREKFIRLTKWQERIYRTGDLVRMLHDGRLEFLGRADDQVKLRGQRLEIGEINSVIKEVKGVADVATLVVSHNNQQKEQLVAFAAVESGDLHNKKILWSPEHESIHFDSNFGNLVESIRKHCHERLPQYMIPTHIIPLSRIPLSANNKVDSKALKSLYASLSLDELQKIYSSDRELSQVEERIVNAMKAANVETVGVTKGSNIFELGLDSISVIGFARELRKCGFGNAQVSVIMQNPTIEGLVQAISSQKNSSDQNDSSVRLAEQEIMACEQRYRSMIMRTLGIERSGIEFIAPCTPLQQGMLSKSCESKDPLYFHGFYFELSNTVDTPRLKIAWEKVMRNTQILRARFLATPDGYVQAFIRDMPLPFHEKPIPSGNEAESFLHSLHRTWWKRNRISFSTPFEITVAQSPEKSIMCLFLLHALYDARSLQMMLNNVMEEYQQSGKANYGLSFREALAKGPLSAIKDAKAFWKTQIGDFEHINFPTLNSNTTKEVAMANSRIILPSIFEQRRRRLNVTHQAIIQASWCLVLQHFLGKKLSFGTIVSGRNGFEGADKVLGPMFNTIPFVCSLRPEETCAELIGRCHDFNVKTLSYQHTPLRNILKACRHQSSRPLFDTLFGFQKEYQDTTPEEGKALWRTLPSNLQADYPLALEVEHKLDDTLYCTIVSQCTISDSTGLSQLLKKLETIIQSVLKSPEQLISNFLRTGTYLVPVAETSPSADNTYVNGVEGFRWTKQSRLVRDEIASLAGLESSEVNEHVSILELGLDSIDAIKLSSRLKRGGIHIPVSHIMKSLTVPKITQNLTVDEGSSHDIVLHSSELLLTNRLRKNLEEKGLVDEHIEDVFPTTPLQEAMVAEMVSSKFKHYYNHDILEIHPHVDLHKLRNAWILLVTQSPILRTRFVHVDDPDLEISFVQVVHRAGNFPWKEIETDLENPLDMLHMVQQEYVTAGEQQKPFKLTLIRSVKSNFLLLSLSHALYDGWSLGLIHEDVQHAYHGKIVTRPSYLSTLEGILQNVGEEASAFWQNALHGTEGSIFPSLGRQSASAIDTIHRSEKRSMETVEAIQHFCRIQGITIQTLGISVWSFTLATRLKKLDVVHGVVLSGRDTEEAQNVLFPTMNTVAVRTILHGSRADVVRDVQRSMNEIREYQHFPLRKVLQLASAENTPLFNTLFLYQKQADRKELEEEPLYRSTGGMSATEYAVCVEFEIVDNSLVWRAACRNKVLDEKGTAELLEQLDKVLSNVIENCGAPALDFSSKGVSVCGLPPFKEVHNISDQEKNPTKSMAVQKAQENPDSWSNTESKIRSVLSKVSKTPEDGISKVITVFHLGLDSISAIKVASLLRKIGINLSVSDLLKAATIQRMASLVDSGISQFSQQQLVSENETVLSPAVISQLLSDLGIPSETVQQVLPATAGQVYILSMWQNSAGTLFNGKFHYTLDGQLSEEELHKGWRALVTANPILRTVFIASMQRSVPFFQVVLEEVPQSFILVPQHENFEQILAATDSNAQPFVRLYAQKYSDHSWCLCLKINHALYDGVSLPLLMRTLQHLLQDTNDMQPSTAPSFATYIAQTGSPQSALARREFWTRYLPKNSTTLQRTPLHQPSSSSAEPFAKRIEVFEPKVLPAAQLERRARSEGVSVHALFLATFARSYFRLAAKDQKEHEIAASASEVVFGVYLANRAQPEGVGRLAAPTLNLVPLRVHVGKLSERKLVDMAREVQKGLGEIGDVNHSAIGLWEIDEWCGIKIDAFVNFLKLPDVDENHQHQKENEICLKEECGRRLERRRDLIELRGEPVLSEAVKGNAVRGSYVHSLDIEATIRNGSLDIGIFAPRSMLDIPGAETVLQEFKETLNNFHTE